MPPRLPSEIAAEDREVASARQRTPTAAPNSGALTGEPNRRSALLVDLDGTLTDPAEGIIGCFRLALETLGRIAPPAAELHWIIGPPLRGCFAEALNGEGDPEEALKIYRARYSVEGLFEATVYDGVKETLAELRAAGTRLFLCTAKPLVYAGAHPEPFRP